MNEFLSALKNLSKRGTQARGVDTRMKFSLEPYPGDTGFTQWRDAMKSVARLPGGIPPEFRKRLWLTLADRYILSRKVDWEATKRFCFNDKSNPDDDKLGVQIVKDLHRTGCSLFSGEAAEHNQALLKRVLLAYARWNKSVGYCQGFNLLAAFVLEVVDWCVENALKMMIYLIEGVLPESYFANHLRGLSVDMAVFRDLLRIRLSSLARHLDKLQADAHDSSTGTSYEPPLTNVFTMQWFLTLFSTCLPKSTVLRVWDLILLEGNEVLLRTALAIWDGLADRIITVESADEFYSIMGVLTREMVEFGLMDANDLVQMICNMAPFPFPQLNELRDKYTYNIRPLTSSLPTPRQGLRLFFSDDEDDNEEEIVVATWCISNAFMIPKNKGGSSCQVTSPSTGLATFDPSRVTLDISTLKRQYAKLRERQKQAHIILAGGFQTPAVSRIKPSLPVNHLLLGQKPIVRKSRPAPTVNYAVKPQTHNETRNPNVLRPSAEETISWEQAKKQRQKPLDSVNRFRKDDSDSSSTSTELCDDDPVDDLSDIHSSPEIDHRRTGRTDSLVTVVTEKSSSPLSFKTAFSDHSETSTLFSEVRDALEDVTSEPELKETTATEETDEEEEEESEGKSKNVSLSPLTSSSSSPVERPSVSSSSETSPSDSSGKNTLPCRDEHDASLKDSEKQVSSEAENVSPSNVSEAQSSSRLVSYTSSTSNHTSADRDETNQQFSSLTVVSNLSSAQPTLRQRKDSQELKSPPSPKRVSEHFNPFPTTRRPSLTGYASEVGIKLGLYSHPNKSGNKMPSIRR